MLRRFQRCKYIIKKSELVGFWQMNRLAKSNVPPLVNEMMWKEPRTEYGGLIAIQALGNRPRAGSCS